MVRVALCDLLAPYINRFFTYSAIFQLITVDQQLGFFLIQVEVPFITVEYGCNCGGYFIFSNVILQQLSWCQIASTNLHIA